MSLAQLRKTKIKNFISKKQGVLKAPRGGFGHRYSQQRQVSSAEMKVDRFS
jgi:hypothetical protein